MMKTWWRRRSEAMRQRGENLTLLSKGLPNVGVLLPAYTPKWKPVLKAIASVTVFVFTFTSILPAGFAQGSHRSDDTLRGLAAPESEVQGGLEEALGGKKTPAVASPAAVPEVVKPVIAASPVPDAPAAKPASSLWTARGAVQPSTGLEEAAPRSGMTRRDFLKVTAAAAAATVVLPGVVNPQQPPVPGVPPAGPVAIAPYTHLRPGLVAQPNTVLLNYQTGQAFLPRSDMLTAGRGMRAVRSVAEEFARQWKEWAQKGAQLLARHLGYTEGAPDPSEVWTDKWNPPPLPRRPDGSTETGEYILWAPWAMDEKWWPVLFEAMRKRAGIARNQTTNKPHSRLFLGIYEAIGFFKIWDVGSLAKIMNLAKEHGVEIIPIVGDPIMAEYPTAGMYLLRGLMDTKTLVPDQDGIIRIAYDIEPYDLEKYEKIKKALKKYEKIKDGLEKGSPQDIQEGEMAEDLLRQWWENVMLIVRDTQRKLSRRFQEASQEDYSDVEVTVFVPPDFPAFAQRMKIVTPPGVRFRVMTYAARPEGVAALAAGVRTAFDADQAAPPEKQFFSNTTYGVAVDIGIAKDPNETLWRDAGQQPYSGSIGERVMQAERLVRQNLQGSPTFDGAMTIHTHTHLDLIWFLRQGGPTPNQAADHELKDYLLQGSRRFANLSSFLSGRVPPEEPLPYGALRNGLSVEERAGTIAWLGWQRALSGMVGGGAFLAHLKSVRDTIVRRTVAPDNEMWLLGPDTGALYTGGGLINSANFGAGARMKSISRTIVDPSKIGFEVALNEGERCRGLEFQADAVIDGRRYAKGSIFVEGTVVPAGVPVREKTVVGAPDRSVKVHGTRLPDGAVSSGGVLQDNGTLVPGRVVVPDSDVMADGRSSKRRNNDLQLTQVPSNRYDLYWGVHVDNLGDKKFAGFVQLRPHAGAGEALDLNTESFKLAPGEQKVFVLHARVGYDDDEILVDPDSRAAADPFGGKGRLLRNARIAEAFFLVNEAAGAAWPAQERPEIVHAAGLATFDPLALAETLRDQRHRAKLKEAVEEEIRNNKLSELSPYSIERPIGVQVTLPQGTDLEQPVELIQSLSELQRSRGVTDVLLESGDLQKLVHQVVDYLQRFNLIDQSPEQMTRLYEELSNSPPAVRLRLLLNQAHKQGLRVGFLLNGAEAEIRGLPMTEEERARDPRGAQAYFRILKDLTENVLIGIDAVHFTALKGHDRLRPEDAAYGIRLYQNAQAPLVVLGARAGRVTVSGREVNQAQDLTGENPVNVLTRLEEARTEAAGKKDKDLGLAVVTPKQCAAMSPLLEADAESIVERLVGPKTDQRLSVGGILSPEWLVQRLSQPTRYLAPLVRVPADSLGLSTISKLTTGHLSFQAARIAPDPTRMLYLRVRVFNKDTGILKTIEIPVDSSQFDFEKPMEVVVQNAERGRYAFNMEVASGIFDPVIPGQAQLSDTPFVVIQGQPAFTVINPGVENRLQLGQHDVQLFQAEPVTITVGDQRRFMEEHWALRTATGTVLHFGRDRSRQTMTYWLDTGPAFELLGNIPQRTAEVQLKAGELPITLQISGTTNRMTAVVDGIKVDFWSLLDQKMVSRWDQAIVLREERQTVKVTVDPTDQAVPKIEVLDAAAPQPTLAADIPTDYRDTTADQVTEHPRRSELIGRILAGVSALVPIGAVVRGAVRGARRVQTALRDARVRSEEREREQQAQTRAAARAAARGERYVPRPVQETRTEGSVRPSTRLWDAFRTVVTAVIVTVALLNVHAIAQAASWSAGFSTPMALVVKLVGIALIFGWLDGLARAFFPRFHQRVLNSFGALVGLLASFISSVGKLAQTAVIVGTLWLWIKAGLSITIPWVGWSFSIPSAVTICARVGALVPGTAILAIAAGFLVAVWVYRRAMTWEQSETGLDINISWLGMSFTIPPRIVGPLNNLAPVFFNIGIGVGIWLFFGITWPVLVAMTVTSLLKVAAVFILASGLGWLVGEFGPTVLPGVFLMAIRMWEGILSASNLYLNSQWQDRKIAAAEPFRELIHWVSNRTPFGSIFLGIAGVALVAKGPALLAAVPVIGIIGAHLMTLMAAPATGVAVAVAVGVGGTLIAAWRLYGLTRRYLERRFFSGGENTGDYLRDSAADQMAYSGASLATGPDADAARRVEVENTQIPAIINLVHADPDTMSADRGLELINVLRREVGLPPIASIPAAPSAPRSPPASPASGLEEVDLLHREILRLHAMRDAETFVVANWAALGIPGGVRIATGPNDTPNLNAFIAARIAEAQAAYAPGGLLARAGVAVGTSRLTTLRAVARQLRDAASREGIPPTLAADLRNAAGRIAAPEDLLKGLAYRREPFEIMLQLDIGAQFSDKPYPGQKKSRPPLYGETVREMIQDLRSDPFKSAIFSAIYVFPGAGLDQWNLGLSAFGVPVVFASQFVQYTASMLVRWSLGHLPGSQERRAGSFVRSEMDPDFWNFQIQVQGRWLTGHLRMMANALFGESLHWDPDSFKPATLTSVRGGMRAVAGLLSRDADPARQVAGQTNRIHPLVNWWYKIGEQPSFRDFLIRDFDDETDNPVTDIADAEALGGYRPGKGVQVVRLHGRNLEGLWLHSATNLEVRLDGQVRAGEQPTKFEARFGPAAPQTPKSARMALALAVMSRIYDIAPRLSDDGNGYIQWGGVTPWSPGSGLPENVLASHERVMHQNRNQARTARRTWFRIAPAFNVLDGSVQRSGLEEATPTTPEVSIRWAPEGQVSAGPKLGWEPQDYAGGRVRQFFYRLADIVTMRRWSEGWPGGRREPLATKAKETFWGTVLGAAFAAIATFYFVGPAAVALGATLGAVFGLLSFLHPVSRTLVARVWYHLGAPLWAGLYLFYVGVVEWAGLIGLMLLSRWFLEPIFRTPIPISFWGFRKDPMISALRYDYDPRHVVSLTERATSQRMQRIPADVAAGSQSAFLRRGLNAIQRVPGLEGLVVDLARGASPQRYDERPNLPEGHWENLFIALIRPLFNQIPLTDRLAAQYVVFHIIQGHRAAAGQPEDLITALNTGSHDPGVPSLGDRNRVMMWFRDHASNATPHSRIPLLLGHMERTVNQRTRSWGWTAFSTPIGGIRVSSTYANPVQAWIDSGSSLSCSEWLLEEQSHLQPDTDAITRASASDSRELLQGPRTIADDPSAGLNGMSWLARWTCPELLYSGMLHPGGKPHRFPILDSILYHVSHGLDQLGVVGQVINRAAGVLASAVVGVLAWKLIPAFVIGASASWGTWAALGIVAGWAAAGLVILVAAVAAVASLYSFDGKDGYRLDQWVNDGMYSGVRGDGIRCLSVIPGFVTWVIAESAFRLFFRIVEEVIHVPYPNYSWEAWVLAGNLGTTPGALFPGLVHNVHWPFWFGPIPPGLPYLSFTLWLRSATVWDAPPIPASVAVRLANEPEWTRVVTQFNYGTSGQMTRHPVPDETLAEDTKVNATMKITPVLLPSSPAESAWLASKFMREFLQGRDDEGAVRRAVNFAKGMGMASANHRLRGGTDDIAAVLAEVRSLPLQEQTNFFTSIMSALEAFDRNEISTAGARGAGVYSYLFTAFTASPLFFRMVGAYAPGEIESLLWFLMFAQMDHDYSGALTQQMAQIQRENGRSVPAILAGSTLFDQIVRTALLDHGTFLDPNLALAAVWVVRTNGTSDGPLRSDDSFHLSQTRPISDYKVNVIHGVGLFPLSLGGIESVVTDTMPNLRTANRVFRSNGRNSLILASTDVLMELELVMDRPVGSPALNPFTMAAETPWGTAGLEEAAGAAGETRRQFLQDLFAGAAALATAAYAGAPEEAGAQQPPPAAGPSVDPDVRAIREIHGLLLNNQASLGAARLRFLQSQSDRLQRLRAVGAVSIEEFQEALVAVQVAPIYAAEGRILQLIRSYLSGRQPLQGEDARAIRAQILAAIENGRTVVQFFEQQMARARQLLGQRTISQEEYELIEAALEGSRFRLRFLEEMRLLYNDLAEIGGYMPLPVAAIPGVTLGANIRSAVPPLPGRRPTLTQEQKDRLLRSVRIHIFNMLKIEKERLEVDIRVRRRLFERAGRLIANDVITKAELELLRFLNAQADQLGSLKNVLTAQQWLVLVGGGIEHPKSAPERPANLQEAQRRLDAAIVNQTRSLLLLADQRVAYQGAEAARADVLARKKESSISAEAHRNAQLNLARAKAQRNILIAQQRLDAALRGLGFPAALLQLTQTISSAVDIQALVQPVQIGVKEQLSAEDIARLRREADAAQAQIYQRQADAFDAEIAQLTEDAKQIEALRRQNAIDAWAMDDARDMLNQIKVHEAQKRMKLAEKEIREAKDQAGFDAAVHRFEDAIVESVRLEQQRVFARAAVLRGRSTTPAGGGFSQADVQFFHAQAETFAARARELELRARLNAELRRQRLPIVDLDRPTGSAAASASPEALDLILKAPTLPVGTIRSADGRSLLLLPGAQWIWLAGPPVTSELNDWIQEDRMVQIREGEHGAGNFTAPEYWQQVRADTGALEGPLGPGTLGRKLYVSSWGPRPYQLASGYYRVETFEDGVTVDPDTEGIRLGIIIRTEGGKQVESTHGLVGFSAYSVRRMPDGKGGFRREYVPVGVVTQEISLEAYFRKGPGGKEAPIPFAPIGKGPDGRPVYGTLYTGGLVTYGPKGEARYGKQNNPGQRPVPVIERAGARGTPMEKEVQVVFNEQTGRLEVSFKNHAYPPKKGGLEEQAPVVDPQLSGLMVAVISDETAAKVGLEELSGQVRKIGNGLLLVLPQNASADEMAEALTPLAGYSGLVFRPYGGLEEFTLFTAVAGMLGSVLPAVQLKGTTLLDLLRQILANLTGLEESEISDDRLNGVLETLGLGAQV